MKTVWLAILILSSVALIAVLLRQRMSWTWVRNFNIHFVLAAAVLYVLNFSGLIPNIYIPLNPVTIGTVVVLGVPGIALIAGVQYFIV
ncbi:pro-sigmaK processing inhibitor BofA family protein [Paenibacillus glycanilyticus]|uniref:pro-sigmaK processing inhibitor BofA family protein n=1 Tax=Paenibacillus glycanilyticus TaxID=126569 RepID=UPI0020407749|nr:pro-sigmaK processing inhibitor BofA family protein [Paenibacillus glycanilyticus]MCM3631600.1 pro-sigmaK processing inhibitor BofA family protein [Paenibacillus glycanilyticus]